MIMSVAYFITLYVIKYIHIIYMPSQKPFYKCSCIFQANKTLYIDHKSVTC